MKEKLMLNLRLFDTSIPANRLAGTGNENFL